MYKRILYATLVTAATAAIAACGTSGTQANTNLNPVCKAGNIENFVGQKVTDKLLVDIQSHTGATMLRFIKPNSPVTMDFSPNRVNVYVTDLGVIKDITCG